MTYLFRRTSDGCAEWNYGAANFLVHQPTVPQGNKIPIAIQCRLGGADFIDIALLDTASDWSILSSDTAEILRDSLVDSTGIIPMMTRFGKITGALHRLPVDLVAEPGWGHDLTIEGVFFISSDWPGPTVIGFSILQGIRFALDPGNTQEEQRFFFGSC